MGYWPMSPRQYWPLWDCPSRKRWRVNVWSTDILHARRERRGWFSPPFFYLLWPLESVYVLLSGMDFRENIDTPSLDLPCPLAISILLHSSSSFEPLPNHLLFTSYFNSILITFKNLFTCHCGKGDRGKNGGGCGGGYIYRYIEFKLNRGWCGNEEKFTLYSR